MPLTKSGEKVYEKMVKEYGSEKGEKVFYASINKGNPGTEKLHKKKYLKKAKELTR